MPRSSGSRKTGPRRKTGCLTCRLRHVRCDEAHPRCGRCTKAGLQCDWNNMIACNVRTQDSSETPSVQIVPEIEAFMDDAPTTIQLFQYFQTGIATWMDVFDHSMSYQIEVLRRATDSELLRRAVCALTSRQLAHVTKSTKWKMAESVHYGASLRLLFDSLATSEPIGISLPALILLLSFELMAGTGTDYRRHFHGALALIKTNIDILQTTDDALLRASYWIFMRHDVNIALARGQVTSLTERYQLHPRGVGEDATGNRALTIASQVATFVAGNEERVESPGDLLKELEQWQAEAKQTLKHFDQLDGVSFWYASPAGTAAMQLYHMAKILLEVNRECGTTQNSAQAIVTLSKNTVSDAVHVQSVQPLVHAAKFTENIELRKSIFELLLKLQNRTGFSSQREVSLLNEMLHQKE